MSDRDIATYCTRLATRQQTLEGYRRELLSTKWSFARENKEETIKKTLDLIRKMLKNPTASQEVVGIWRRDWSHAMVRESIVAISEKAAAQGSEGTNYAQKTSTWRKIKAWLKIK